MILVCNNPTAAEQVLDALPVTQNPLREQRLQAMRGRFELNREQLMELPKWQEIARILTHRL
jgi:beta-N-acetylhexosaminidase